MLLVDGQLVSGEGSVFQRSESLDSCSPGSYRFASAAQVETVLSSASGYVCPSVSERKSSLLAIVDSVRKVESDLVQLLVDEIGKPVRAAKAEVERMAITFALAAKELDRWGDVPEDLSYDDRGKGVTAQVRRFPVGPIFAITPYNWPFNLAAHKIAPAIATGSPVILKGSPQSVLCTAALGPILQASGAVQILACDNELSEKIARDPRIKMVSFTGSPAVGWYLRSILARKRVTLELGGDATAILCPTTDLVSAVPKLIDGAFAYSGQICISVQHALIHESIYEETKRKLIAAVLAIRSGDPHDPNTLVGPLISTEAAEKVERWIEGMGSEPLVRGTRQGPMLTPSLLEWKGGLTRVGVPEMMREEAFGPVLIIQPYRRFDEALHWVNGSQYGIQAGVFTSDEVEVALAFENLDVCAVVINHVPTLRFDSLPYGGQKASGVGREGVRYAMDEMSEPKALVRAQS